MVAYYEMSRKNFMSLMIYAIQSTEIGVRFQINYPALIETELTSTHLLYISDNDLSRTNNLKL